MGSVFGPVRFLLPVCRLSWFLYTLNVYAHFSQQLLMTSNIWSQASYRYAILWEAFLYPCSPKGEGDILFYLCPSKIFFVAFFSATIDGRNLIFGHKLYIGTPYRGKRFWTHQIPTSCLPIFNFVDFYTHLTYICICTFFVAFFSTTIDGRSLIFGHKLHIGTPYRGKHFLTCQIPTSCLPKSGGIIGEH